MGLNFIGDRGIYISSRDAVKITALDGDRVVECYATRSALTRIGCPASAMETLSKFEERRIDIEIAAMAKYRRSRVPSISIDVHAEDLEYLAPASAA